MRARLKKTLYGIVIAVAVLSYRLHAPAPGDLAAWEENGKVKVALVESVDEAAGTAVLLKVAPEPRTMTVRIDRLVGRVFIVTR